MIGEVDLERRVTDWLRVDAPDRAPERVLAATLDRVAVLGQERTLPRWRLGDRRGSNRVVLIAATAALLALLVATAVFIGNQLREDVQPAPTVAPSVAPTVAPTAPASTSFAATAPPAPARLPTTMVDSGAATTDIGRIAWTTVKGDASNLPWGEIFETPEGFASIETDVATRTSRLWLSADGLDWQVAPMPVPAEGFVGHSVAAGEHWISSSTDLRIWRSSDFATWQEVDLAAVRPPAIHGIRWSFGVGGPATLGSTTVVAWSAIGSLALDEHFDVPLRPDQELTVDAGNDPAAIGDVRPVYRRDITINSFGIGSDEGEPNLVQVGSIRVEVADQLVTVIDAERDVVLAEVDAMLVGVPAVDLADGLNLYGQTEGPGHGALITGGTASAITLPDGDIWTIRGRFTALADDSNGQLVVWTSTDGVDWTSLGPPVFPTATGDLGVLPQATDAEPLTAVARIEKSGAERFELWTSTDGRRWKRLGVLAKDLEMPITPAVSGGFLAIGGDFRIHVSGTGADWAVVKGLAGVLETVSANGGTHRTWATRDTIFHMDAPLTGERIMWVMRIDPGS